MAKRRTKGGAAEAPNKGAATATGVEKDERRDMASEKKDGGDAAADGVVIGAPVHCDGCARKLRRSLLRLDGVEEVTVDSRSNTVVVRGPGAVENAREAVEVVGRKTGKQKATLLSPSPDKLPSPAAVKGAQMKKDDAGGDVVNEITDVDTEMVVVLRINLHCDGCSEEIKRRILKIEGVKEAVPLLKSSQMMVKGMVEPATLVGFIHKSTGRKAAIIRAEPLDQLLPPTKSPPMDDAPLMEAEATKQQDPNPGEKKDAHGNKEMNGAPPHQAEDHAAGEELGSTEKASEGHGVEDPHDTHDGVVLENNKKDDRLFTVPLPPGVVTVAPEMALTKLNPYYAYPPYPFAHLHHYYQCPPPYYPYAYNPDMYGYPHYPPEAFSEENPNACAIV